MKIKKIFSTLILVTFLSGSLLANSNGIKTYSNSSVENLKVGIKSDNVGLKKSAVYLAGKYKIKATTEALINQLEDEENTSIKKLIIMSLYEINIDSSSNLDKELAAIK